MITRKPLVLVDGSSYLFRAYHALPPLMNSKGMPTGAIYGVLNMLKKLLKEYQPEHVAVVFDPKGKNFRHELYPAYKANRGEMPDELRVQIAPLHEAIEALGLPLVIVDGVEADDVIGSLAKAAEHVGLETIISTGDKDMAQLVNSHISLVNTMTDKQLDTKGVKEKFGVAPDRIIDYLALMGDASDNIPGVPKVGPKTAVKWLTEYDSLDGVIDNADNIKGKVGENLRAHLNELPLSRQLVTIKLDIPLPISPEKLMPSKPDHQKLCTLFSELEFKNWLTELKNNKDTEKGDEPVSSSYATLLDQSVFNQWCEQLQQSRFFVIDTETTGLDAMQAELVGISFALESGEAAYLPLMHDYPNAPKQLKKEVVLGQLQTLLNNPNQFIIGQNLKYDIKVLRKAGIEITTPKWDTLLASYVMNSTSSRHDMDSLALQYLARSTIKFEEVAGKGAKQLTFNQVSLDQATEYAAEDADVTLQLYQKLKPLIEQEAAFQKVFSEIEMPLMPILADMEYQGVLIDAKKLAAQSADLAKRIHNIEQEIYALSGEEFNIASTKQLQVVLYEKLKLPILKKTPKGAASTAENVLQDLALDYPLPKLILEFRSLSKLKSTYTDALPEQINPQTGRIHTSYNQAVTSTGRLSSNHPNLQNIPVRTEEGCKIRQAFIAPQHHKIVSADYSQIELRIMAHLSQDPNLLKAFANGHDVHAATAAEVNGIAIEAVMPEQRRDAKAVNFGLIYGMSAFGLSKQLGVTRQEAQQYIDTYFQRYPKVHEYMEQARQIAAEKGYVETLFGRRLMIPDINASNAMRRMAAERAAINAPLQGTAADIIKLSMICIDQWLKQSDIDVKMIMQVHDELVFEVQEDMIDAACQHIRDCMQKTTSLSVPLLVEIGVGDNWDEAH